MGFFISILNTIMNSYYWTRNKEIGDFTNSLSKLIIDLGINENKGYNVRAYAFDQVAAHPMSLIYSSEILSQSCITLKKDNVTTMFRNMGVAYLYLAKLQLFTENKIECYLKQFDRYHFLIKVNPFDLNDDWIKEGF